MLWLAGTNEVVVAETVSRVFLDAVDRTRFRVFVVAYDAQYGDPEPYADSRASGRANLLAAIRATPNLVAIGGFSQGAGIAGDLAAEVGRGEHPDISVVGCALIADPLRPPNTNGTAGQHLVGVDPGGYGISGARLVEGVPAYWVAAHGDPITSLPSGSPLRSIADLSSYWSTDPEGLVRFITDMAFVIWARKLRRWWDFRRWRDWRGATAWLTGYLTGGRHTTAYVGEGLAVQLAEAVNSWIEVEPELEKGDCS